MGKKKKGKSSKTTSSNNLPRMGVGNGYGLVMKSEARARGLAKWKNSRGGTTRRLSSRKKKKFVGI